MPGTLNTSFFQLHQEITAEAGKPYERVVARLNGHLNSKVFNGALYELAELLRCAQSEAALYRQAGVPTAALVTSNAVATQLDSIVTAFEGFRQKEGRMLGTADNRPALDGVADLVDQATVAATAFATLSQHTEGLNKTQHAALQLSQQALGHALGGLKRMQEIEEARNAAQATRKTAAAPGRPRGTAFKVLRPRGAARS